MKITIYGFAIAATLLALSAMNVNGNGQHHVVSYENSFDTIINLTSADPSEIGLDVSTSQSNEQRIAALESVLETIEQEMRKCNNAINTLSGTENAAYRDEYLQLSAQLLDMHREVTSELAVLRQNQ